MSQPESVGRTVLARMFGHTVQTKIAEVRIGYRGQEEYRLEVPPEIAAEIQSESQPGSHAWESIEAFWTTAGAIGHYPIDSSAASRHSTGEARVIDSLSDSAPSEGKP